MLIQNSASVDCRVYDRNYLIIRLIMTEKCEFFQVRVFFFLRKETAGTRQ